MSKQQQRPPITASASVRRKAALLVLATIALATLGYLAYASGYPAGMSLLAASTMQAAICCTMFGSRLLQGLAATSFALFLFNALVVSRHLAEATPAPVFELGDFCAAVFAIASMVFTPIETVALLVREARLRRPPDGDPPPR